MRGRLNGWIALLRAPRYGALAPALICTALTIVHTWPLATDPATLSRNDNGDAQLNEWIMAWIAHQLPRDPLHLFDANIFYPAKDVLAFSEPLIVPALMGAPVSWLGGSPVLAHNLVLLAGFFLTALAGWFVVREWTGDGLAALVAASLAAFNTHTLTRTAHVQGVQVYGLVLSVLAISRLIERRQRRDGLFLAACMILMAYTSGYLFVFASVMIALALIVRVREWIGDRGRAAAAFGISVALSAAAILPVYLPYRRAARDQGMLRPLESVAEYSATLKGYIAATGRIHFSTWSARLYENPVDSFFPGIVAALLAIGGVWWGLRRPQPERGRTLMLVAIGIAGFILSLGTRTPIYGWLFHIFPPMQGLRAAARFGNLFLIAIALLAGFGVASLRQRFASRRWIAAAAISAIVLVNVEALRAPFDYREFTGVPQLYASLASEPGPVVLVETPFYPAHAVFENAEYVLNSTAHWRPLMNGYSGYTPDSYRRYADVFWYFPRPHAVQAMRDAGVTHVTFHPRRFGHEADAALEQIAANPHLELVAIAARSGIRLYRLR